MLKNNMVIQLLEENGFFLWETDYKYILKYLSPLAATISGIPMEKMLGMSIFDFLPDVDSPEVLWSRNLTHNPSTIHVQCEFIQKDGQINSLEIMGHRQQKNDGDYFVGTGKLLDTSDEKNRLFVQREQRLRMLFETANDLIMDLDKQENILSINPAGCALLGYKPQELSGNSIKMVIDPQFHNISDEYSLKKLKHETDVTTYEINFISKSGEKIPLELSTRLLYSGEEIIGYQGIGRDIRERRRFEEERIKTQKLESIGLLAGGIAHDFNNILVSIIGNINLLQFQEDANKETKEILHDLETGAFRARDLTKQLLTFSKGGSPVKKIMDIKTILKESASFILRGSKSTCKYIFEENIPPVDVDPGQISQVMHNLLMNAIQAMSRGGTIKIYLSNVASNTLPSSLNPDLKYIRIAVRDTGHGIPKHLQEKIFDPYFTTKKTGTGLGLATSYSIIKNHNGLLSFTSESGIGSTFSFYLPTIDAEVKPLESDLPIAIRQMNRILVMDDDKNIHLLLSRILKKLGFRSTFTFEGGETIQSFLNAKKQKDPYKMIIMDLTIPGGMGGKETVKRIRDLDSEVSIIVSSGYSNDPIMAHHSEYGFDGVLIKPYTLRQLKQVLAEYSN
ncbi:Sensor histidine kinase RcsC [Candidatus Lokiarchaeum ossiferum]|uniref:Sensor histidine kinase RcsC n=1 Tax=Candidatus Lokiarchaeum ossiferum TaxID=2951803 RepID=A0ABY6HW20_9ARCH|nr:Sensor histidine kinase RcsC [Candidatus Lokiarchaeum sp. B-35]